MPRKKNATEKPIHWTWHVGTDGNVYDGETGGNLVASISHNANGPDAPSSRPANGSLIATAPELLTELARALILIIGCSVYDCRGTNHRDCKVCEERRRIHAVISRAKGESP